MKSSFSPYRLLLLSAVVAVAAVGVLFWMLTDVWKMQYIDEGKSLALHTQAERERVLAIEKMEHQTLPPRPPEIPPSNVDSAELRTISALRRRMEERYDITVLLFDAAFLKAEGIDAHPYPISSVQEHLKHLNDWLRMYPPEYIKHSGLKTIALFKGWEQNSVQTSGFLLDRSTIGIEAIPTVFHHELFHLADMNDGGMENENADWLRAKYGETIPEQPGFDALQAIAKNLHMTERPAGFMNAYGKYGGVDEDQASVAEYMLSYPELTNQLEAEDAVLASSMHAMKRFFFAHSDGLMDETFWNDLLQKKMMDEQYWDAHRPLPKRPE